MKAWIREMHEMSLVSIDKGNFLESDFGAASMVGVGAIGLAIGLAESPTNWLFVIGSVMSLLGGLVIFCMVKAASHEHDDC